MIKNIIVCGTLISMLTLLTSCKLGEHINAQVPCSDPLEYYTELSLDIIDERNTTEQNTQPAKGESEACFRLHEAIRLSMPGSPQQNDIKALTLLKDLKNTDDLSESDQRFNNMLLQHVSQRQKLRNMIGSQDERLKKTETQLDQLKDIEVEIDKKERSVTSPGGE